MLSLSSFVIHEFSMQTTRLLSIGGRVDPMTCTFKYRHHKLSSFLPSRPAHLSRQFCFLYLLGGSVRAQIRLLGHVSRVDLTARYIILRFSLHYILYFT